MDLQNSNDGQSTPNISANNIVITQRKPNPRAHHNKSSKSSKSMKSIKSMKSNKSFNRLDSSRCTS